MIDTTKATITRIEADKIAMVDNAINAGMIEAEGALRERKRIVAILEADPKLRYVASLINTSSAPFNAPTPADTVAQIAEEVASLGIGYFHDKEQAEERADALLALVEEAAKVLGSGSYFGFGELSRLHDKLLLCLNEDKTR